MASSISLQRLLFPPSKPHHRPTSVSAAARTSTSTPAPGTEVPEAVDSSRLVRRVEQTENGYWVLKEKHRAGINPQEKVKLEKEPMLLFMEGGIDELAAVPMEEIEKSKLSKDDVDVRLKWLGLFHRRKHQCNSSHFIYLIFINPINSKESD
jgi:ferredoxin-nitrite reductase